MSVISGCTAWHDTGVYAVPPIFDPTNTGGIEYEGNPDLLKFNTVKVSFATNRKIQTSGKNALYTSEPGELSYGFCYVSIPKDHKMGDMETPSPWNLEFTPNPEKHIVVLITEKTTRQKFFDDIAKNIDGTKKSNAFVFVHGFNVTFEDAARRTAQMAYDLQFDGVPVFFSWPSNGNLQSYTVDERNIEWAEPDLKAFLADFLKNSKADNVYVIGHSMGTRALTRSIAAIGSEDPKALSRLKGIILAAPDIDAVVFKKDIVPKLMAAKRNVTMYASSNDRALQASKEIHGYPRAGQTGAGLVIVSGMDTIDASSQDTSLIGHSYYGDKRSIISDMYYLFKAQLPASQRSGLASAGKAPDLYWMFRP
jgi:esterase/lipase superfamily enzyme